MVLLRINARRRREHLGDLAVGGEEAVGDASCSGVDDRSDWSGGVEGWVGEEHVGEGEVVGGVAGQRVLEVEQAEMRDALAPLGRDANVGDAFSRVFQQAGAHFNKLECFCFNQYTLAPGEKKQWPVAFVIDNKLPREVTTITLSYTFFEVGGKTPAAPAGYQSIPAVKPVALAPVLPLALPKEVAL